MFKQNLTQPQTPNDYVVSGYPQAQTQTTYAAPGQFTSTNTSISVDMNGVNWFGFWKWEIAANKLKIN